MIKLHEIDLLHCCGSTRWAREMAAHTFPNPKEVIATADSIWWSLTPEDRAEASNGDPEKQLQVTHLRLKRLLTGFR